MGAAAGWRAVSGWVTHRRKVVGKREPTEPRGREVVVPVEENEILLEQDLEYGVEKLKDFRQHEEACPDIQVRADEIDRLWLGTYSVPPAARCHLVDGRMGRKARRVSVERSQHGRATRGGIACDVRWRAGHPCSDMRQQH